MSRPNHCRVYWGSHGCMYDTGHAGPHICECCDCTNHPDFPACVGAPPYYGPETYFYGDDVGRGEGVPA